MKKHVRGFIIFNVVRSIDSKNAKKNKQLLTIKYEGFTINVENCSPHILSIKMPQINHFGVFGKRLPVYHAIKAKPANDKIFKKKRGASGIGSINKGNAINKLCNAPGICV